MGYKLKLEIPENIYEKLLKTAKQTRHTPEEIALDCLANVSEDSVENDVQVHKKARKRLETQEEYLRLAIEGGEIGLWEIDLQTDEFTWSDTLYEMLGRDREVPITFNTFFEYILEKERSRVRQHAQQWFASGGEFEDEFRIVREDGQVRWFASVGRLYCDYEGQPSRAAGVNFDITEYKRTENQLRQSEKKYHQLFESMNEGFLLIEIILDESGKPVSFRYLDANPALESLTHLKREDIIGKDVHEVLPEIESHWIETFGHVAMTGEPAHIEQYSKALNGWYDVRVYCPEPGKAAVIYINVTERKQSTPFFKKRWMHHAP